MRFYISLLLGIIAAPMFSQSIQNIKAVFIDGEIIIEYALSGGNMDQKYQIEVFGSHNNYQSPLSMVRGDVGKAILAGTAKKIVWDVLNELETFDGYITFHIKGSLDGMPLTFISPNAGSTLRRGKNFTIKWAGGDKNLPLKLELIKNGQPVQFIGEESNTGYFVGKIPKTTEKGTYTIKLTSTGEIKESSPFVVKGKVPVIFKILPFLGLGGAAAFLLKPTESKENDEMLTAPGPK